jgi:hypothetical protein
MIGEALSLQIEIGKSNGWKVMLDRALGEVYGVETK